MGRSESQMPNKRKCKEDLNFRIKMVKEKQTGSVLLTPPPPKVVRKKRSSQEKARFQLSLRGRKGIYRKNKKFFK